MKESIILGIDASRCRSGGTYAHIKGVLNNLDVNKFGIKEVHIWSHPKLLNQLANETWLFKHSPKLLNGSLINQAYWQARKLRLELKQMSCNILLTLDASSLCRFQPQVVLSRDMLSYEPGILQKYKWGFERVRLLLILWLQNAAFRRADGVVFLTKYAATVIQQSCGKLQNIEIIPHGVDEIFKNIRRSKKLSDANQLINCLYISNADLYKNQWHVVHAIELLRNEGLNINLTLVGGGKGRAQKILEEQILKSDPYRKFVKVLDFVPQSEIPIYLNEADIFIFASSCENMPNTLIEAMAAGLPIACSNRGPMPEILNQGGVLFDPENPTQIASAVRELIENKSVRDIVVQKATVNASQYSWQRCSNETFSYVVRVMKKYKNDKARKYSK